MFDFGGMLKKYEQPATTTVKTEGYFDDETGKWVPGELEIIETSAAILPLTDEEMMQGEGGSYTRDDRKMYYHGELPHGQEVKVGDKVYTVDAIKDYSYHALGLRVYILVRKGVAG